MAAETFLCFGPDELAEARNRGYKPYKGNGSGVETGRVDPRGEAVHLDRAAWRSPGTWPGPASRPAPTCPAW